MIADPSVYLLILGCLASSRESHEARRVPFLFRRKDRSSQKRPCWCWQQQQHASDIRRRTVAYPRLQNHARSRGATASCQKGTDRAYPTRTCRTEHRCSRTGTREIRRSTAGERDGGGPAPGRESTSAGSGGGERDQRAEEASCSQGKRGAGLVRTRAQAITRYEIG